MCLVVTVHYTELNDVALVSTRRSIGCIMCWDMYMIGMCLLLLVIRQRLCVDSVSRYMCLTCTGHSMGVLCWVSSKGGFDDTRRQTGYLLSMLTVGFSFTLFW